MELNINRLKVLGEEELQRLDKKILEYQFSSEPTILTKSIDEIQGKIRDINVIINQLIRDLNSKEKQLSGLQADLSALEQNYTRSEENLVKLENSIASLKADIDLKEVKLGEMDENIVRLKTNELVLKEQLADVDSKLTFRTEQFLKEQDELQTRIRELEQKLKMSIQNSFTQHDEFVKQIKSIKLEPIIDDCQAIFDNIKMDLVLVLSRNCEKYKQIPERHVTDRGDSVIDTIHQKICGCSMHGYVGNCGYTRYNVNHPSKIQSDQSIKWLETNYKIVLSKIITHKELKYIIEKLNYSQFKKLFVESQLYDLPSFKEYDSGKVSHSYFNSYGFLLFVLFIGTNGEFTVNCLYTLNH